MTVLAVVPRPVAQEALLVANVAWNRDLGHADLGRSIRSEAVTASHVHKLYKSKARGCVINAPHALHASTSVTQVPCAYCVSKLCAASLFSLTLYI